MATQEEICDAIRNRHVISFWYEGSSPSRRVVEPHLLGWDEAGDDLTLSAWQLSGGSGSGWRDFHASNASELSTTGQTFSAPRPGYNPSDSTMSRIVCRI